MLHNCANATFATRGRFRRARTFARRGHAHAGRPAAPPRTCELSVEQPKECRPLAGVAAVGTGGRRLAAQPLAADDAAVLHRMRRVGAVEDLLLAAEEPASLRLRALDEALEELGLLQHLGYAAVEYECCCATLREALRHDVARATAGSTRRKRPPSSSPPWRPRPPPPLPTSRPTPAPPPSAACLAAAAAVTAFAACAAVAALNTVAAFSTAVAAVAAAVAAVAAVAAAIATSTAVLARTSVVARYALRRCRRQSGGRHRPKWRSANS